MKLSNREITIIELISKGDSYKEIAQKLLISPRTVQTHIERVKIKLGAKNKTNAVVIYLQQASA